MIEFESIAMEVEGWEGSDRGGWSGEEERGRLVMFLHGQSWDIVDQMFCVFSESAVVHRDVETSTKLVAR